MTMTKIVEFPGTTGYDEALFRQVLGKELDENAGVITDEAIADAFLQSLPDAPLIKEQDPNAFDDYVQLMLSVLEHEQALAGPNWRP